MIKQNNETTPKFGLKVIIKGLKDIIRYTTKYNKGKIGFVFFLIVISSMVDALTPYIWGRTIDSITAGKNITLFEQTFLEAFAILSVYLVLLIIQSFADLKKALEARWIQENTRTSYISDAYKHLFRLPLSFHKNSKAGENTEKVSKAGRAMGEIFADAVLNSLPQLVTAIIMFFFVVTTNLYIGIVVTIAVAGYIYFSAKEIAPTVALQRQVHKAYATAHGIIHDSINNIRSVKDFATEDYEFSRIKKEYQEGGMTTWYKLVQIQRHTGAMQNRIQIVVRAFVLFISIYLISQGSMSVGEMIAYNTYALMIFRPLSMIINNWKMIQNGLISLEEAETVLGLPTEVYTSKNTHKIIVEGNIKFDHVDFYYDQSNPVLKNINFEVKQGETVALVGESGVGKSTLIDLLSAYHFPTKGSILIEGVNIKEVDLNTLRENIGVVSQEVTLFNDTIENNLTYGSFDKTKDEIREAARKAHCVDFIEKFPETWNQKVGEKGLKLSVGQKQRVAIARAILKDPKILILDEPTSALDAGTEKIISESLNILMEGRTTFIVAHRLSTVRKADMIFVFKNGEIVEKGKHPELIAIENGEYRRLHELQIGLHE